MSLDISRSVAHLPPERRAALIREYRRLAKHDTTAFLYCFFLGAIGAHRMYLGQWRAALPRLVLSAIFLVDLAVGISLQWPVVAVVGFAAILLLVVLGWEIRDLFHIDAEVEQYNAALAERLLGEPLSVAAARAPASAPSASSAIGTITAGDVAGAFALAQGVTAGRVAESSSDLAPAASSPATAPAPAPMPAPMPAMVPVVTPAPVPAMNGVNGAASSAPTRAAEAPSAPLTLSAPAADLTDRHPHARQSHPVADVEGTTAGAVYVDLSTPTAPATPAPGPTDGAVLPGAAGIAGAAIAAAGIAGAAAMAAGGTAETAATPPTHTRDLTDHHPYSLQQPPVADIEGASAGAVHIALPQAHPPSDLSELAITSDAAIAQDGDDALLVLVPEEERPLDAMRPWGMAATAPASASTPPAPAGSPSASPSTPPVPVDAYVPPTISSVEQPPVAPVWPVAPEATSPAPPIWPVQPSAGQADEDTRTLAELAAFGTAAGAAAYAVEHAREHMPAPEPAPAAPMDAPAPQEAPASVVPPVVAAPPAEVPPPAPSQPMKRVRVVRKIVLEDGGVVRELVAERIVPMDADSQAIAAELEAQLGHATPEEIAQLAHLPSDTSVVVRSRVESGPLSGKLTPPSEGGSGDGTPPAQGS